MSKEIALCNNEIYSVQGSFTEIAEENNIKMSFKKEAMFAMQALQSNDFLTSVAMRNPQSLKNSIVNIASIGLSLNPALKNAYLVPRNGQVCLDVSYMGLCELAAQSGYVRLVQAKLVHQNDNFSYCGISKEPEHKFNPFGDRGEIIGVYCVAVTFQGEFLTEMMSIKECHDIRDRTDIWKKRKSGPWKTDNGEMMKKTVVKRAAKFWPKTKIDSRFMTAVNVINEHEGIDFEAEKDIEVDVAIGKKEIALKVDYEAKNVLVESIKKLSSNICKDLDVKGKGEFMVEVLKVSSFNDLNKKETHDLENLITELNSIE